MLSDSGLHIAGHTISSTGLLIAGALLLCAAAFLLAVARKGRVALQRSAVTDEIAIQLGRIADAMDRVANQTPVSIAPAAGAERAPTTPTMSGRHTIPYSMFGREQ